VLGSRRVGEPNPELESLVTVARGRGALRD
ncbi:unnamed protein product, partial [marine sediment metagenome]